MKPWQARLWTVVDAVIPGFMCVLGIWLVASENATTAVYLVTFVGAVLVRLLVFYPVTWWLRRRRMVRIDRELRR